MGKSRLSVAALAFAAGWAVPVQAQSSDPAAVERELAAMRAQMQQMAQRIDTLESQLREARAGTDAAVAAAAAPLPAAAAAKPETAITWDGAPRISSRNGWSFKPRGRIQVDTAGVSAPSDLAAHRNLGVTSEFRRIYLGFDGTMPGGFGYRLEADLAGGSADLTDVYMTYKATPELTLTVGQHKPFNSLEDMTSDLFTSFMERAAFNSAFNFERRIGASATYTGKRFLVQGGVFTDNFKDLNDTNNSFSLDGRAVFMPRLAGGQLHIGGSLHYRTLNNLANAGSGYGARPFVHTTDVKFVNTGTVTPVSAEFIYGAELAYIRGPFHATVESSWLNARRPGLPDPTFNGGYAEVGMMLTGDETAYKGGAYDRIRPRHPIGNGGLGAVLVNARYDWLDLDDAGIRGGRQQIAGVSLQWIPIDYVRFIFNYGHLWFNGAVLPTATGNRDYTADSMGVRAQLDF
ncbi:MAG: porin [Novosphingobium sp.]|nr:porin [Novosphingobium sp.]